MNITLITHPLSDAVSAATGYRWFDANARFYRLVQRADLKPRASIVAPSGNTRLTTNAQSQSARSASTQVTVDLVAL